MNSALLKKSFSIIWLHNIPSSWCTVICLAIFLLLDIQAHSNFSIFQIMLQWVSSGLERHEKWVVLWKKYGHDIMLSKKNTNANGYVGYSNNDEKRYMQMGMRKNEISSFKVLICFCFLLLVLLHDSTLVKND